MPNVIRFLSAIFLYFKEAGFPHIKTGPVTHQTVSPSSTLWREQKGIIQTSLLSIQDIVHKCCFREVSLHYQGPLSLFPLPLCSKVIWSEDSQPG